MALTTITEIGKISISEDLITTIAGYAAMENYGWPRTQKYLILK